MAGGFQYLETKLNYFPHPEGYVTIVDDKFRYVYNYTDHLGNVRLSYSDADADGTIDSHEIMEENNYYPFGLKHEGYNSDVVLSSTYKFNGFELQDELSLNLYDFGARFYDPAKGRWDVIDPLAEKSRRYSPYSYALDNPVFFIDPDGMRATGFDWQPDKNGNLIAEKGDNTATLAQYLGTSTQDISSRFTLTATGKSVPENHEFKEGSLVTLDNNVTRAINRSEGGSVDDINSGKAKIDRANDNYVCDECAQMAANGDEITPENALKYSQFPNPMAYDETPGFTEVDSFEGVKFNQGIASIGGQHTVSYYGTSKDGTVYVTTKNGREAKPMVATLQQVIKDFNKNQNTNFTINDVKYFKKK